MEFGVNPTNGMGYLYSDLIIRSPILISVISFLL